MGISIWRHIGRLAGSDVQEPLAVPDVQEPLTGLGVQEPPRDRKERAGENPARWKGRTKLALLAYLLKHGQAAQRKTIAAGASKCGAGTNETALRNLHDLIAHGWMAEGKSGTCLSSIGIRKAKKALEKQPL